MSQKPNILILFTDQQRRDTIHELGNERIITPALDEIAREAVVFDNCFTPAPVCVPARFSMYSGLYPGHTGCCNNNGANVYEGSGFYDAITKSGYESCCVGKMHHVVDSYGLMGFSERHTQEELSYEQDDYTNFIRNSPYKNVFDYNGQRSEMYYIPQISQLPIEAHPTQWVGDRSVEFIEKAEGDKPLFLMASFIHPHPPFAPPAPWNKMYRTESEDPYMPADRAEFEPFMSDRFTKEKIGISRQDLTLLRNYYYSCISFVDYQISRIIKALKDKGLYDNTVIMFSTDHGEMLGDFGTMGKRSMLDGAAHIPFMLRVPGIKAGHRDDVCSLVDVAPTLMKLAGADFDKDGIDGVDLFGGETHTEVYSQYSTGKKGAYMVATDRDKLVYHGGTGRYFYFDTIPEDTNKYDESNPRVMELKALLDKYMSGDRSNADFAATADEVSGVNKMPYGPKRCDHLLRQAEELARMPAGYPIDL